MIVAIQFLHPRCQIIHLKHAEFRYYGESPEVFVRRALRYCDVGVTYNIRVYAAVVDADGPGGLIPRNFTWIGAFDDQQVNTVADAIIKDCQSEQ